MRVYFCDSTLRDGEQTPGVAFRRAEKIALAQLLDEAGVDEIEVGVPAMGGWEAEGLTELISLPMRARPVAWNRMRWEDIAASLRCGASRLHLAMPVSDVMLQRKLSMSREEALFHLLAVVEKTCSQDVQISVGFEDASRADPLFLSRVIRALEPYPILRFRVADTLGVLTPFSTRELILRLKDAGAKSIEFHGHNDLGMAVANTLAAVEAGSDWVGTTVLGLGERAGNAALEVVAVAVRRLLDKEVHIRLPLLRRLAEQVSAASGMHVPPQAPVVGDRVFTHESGIHVDGVLKSPETYEPYPPEWVGREHSVVFGKHSGRNGLRRILERRGYFPTADRLDALLEAIHLLAVVQKRFLTEETVCRLYCELCNSSKDEPAVAHRLRKEEKTAG